jgi:hypothetical protein
MTQRSTQILGWTLTAAATYAAVFVLPYRFPLREPVLSDTWIAGANNQVAAVAVALVSIVVTLFCWYRNNAAPEPCDTRERLGGGYLFAGILVAILWTAGLGWAVARAHMYWGDEGYFLNQLRTGLIFHKTIYTEFEFAYGPLLYLWPAACIRLLATLGISFTAAYLVSLALLQSAGLALAFYTVRALPLRRSYQACAFCLIALGTLNSLLGLNYSAFRFILPFAAVVLLSRQRTLAKAALVATFCEIACLATSPELGFAFAGAAIVVAIYRSFSDGSRWLLAALAPVAGAGLFYALVGPAYFFTLGNMARGGYNVLLRPVPPIIGLLLAAVVLAPLAVARQVRKPGDRALILAFYVAALGMLPAALGRSDAIHVFFDGIGLYLLSLVALNNVPVGWRRAGIFALPVVLALTVAHNFKSDQHRLSLILGPRAVQEDWGFDETALRNAIGTAQISAPILAPQRVIDDLTRTGQYVPDYFCGWVGVWDRESEERKIADMRRTEFALVAFTDPVDPDLGRDREIHLLMRMGLASHPPRPEYVRGALLDAELQSHWIARERFGDYELYQQRR